MATKTVGTGGDFANMAAYQAYFNALDMTGPEYCNLMPGETVDTVNVTLTPKSGSSSVNRLYIRPAVGSSWRENANVRNNAVRYNPANGAALRSTVGGAYGIEINCPVTIEGIQYKGGSSSTFPIKLNGNNSEFRYNIVEANTSVLQVVNLVGVGIIAEKNFVIQKGTAGGLVVAGSGATVLGNTIVALGTGTRGLMLDYALAPVAKNNIVVNFTTDYDQTAGTGSSNNATSNASFSNASYGTTGGQVSVLAASFVSLVSGSEDLRLTASATKLINMGTTTGTAQDASGLAQPSGSAYDIGAWEYQAAADTTAPILSAPTATATGATTATGTVATDEGGGTLYFLATANATETAATIKASGGTQAVSATGTRTVAFTGLTAGATYYAHYVQVDAANNTSAVANSASFTTQAVDSVAPTWPNGAAITPGATTSSSLSFSYPAASDNVGVAKYQTSKNSGANWDDNGTGLSGQYVGLTAATTYPIWVRAVDAQSNASVPLQLSMTTSAASTGSFKSSPLENNTGTLYAAGTAVAVTWYQGGRIGAAPTSVTHTSGTVAADGTITLTGLPIGAGYGMYAVQGTNAATDKPYYEAGTVA